MEAVFHVNSSHVGRRVLCLLDAGKPYAVPVASYWSFVGCARRRAAVSCAYHAPSDRGWWIDLSKEFVWCRPLPTSLPCSCGDTQSVSPERRHHASGSISAYILRRHHCEIGRASCRERV